MDLDEGTLVRIDRRVLSGLGHDENYRMIRVPVSDAVVPLDISTPSLFAIGLPEVSTRGMELPDGSTLAGCCVPC